MTEVNSGKIHNAWKNWPRMRIPCRLIQSDPGSRWDHPNLWKRESRVKSREKFPIPEKSKENLGKKWDWRHILGQGREIAATAPPAPSFELE